MQYISTCLQWIFEDAHHLETSSSLLDYDWRGIVVIHGRASRLRWLKSVVFQNLSRLMNIHNPVPDWFTMKTMNSRGVDPGGVDGTQVTRTPNASKKGGIWTTRLPQWIKGETYLGWHHLQVSEFRNRCISTADEAKMIYGRDGRVNHGCGKKHTDAHKGEYDEKHEYGTASAPNGICPHSENC